MKRAHDEDDGNKDFQNLQPPSYKAKTNTNAPVQINPDLECADYLTNDDVRYIRNVIDLLQKKINRDHRGTQVKKLESHVKNFNEIVELAEKEKEELNVFFVGTGGIGKSTTVSSIIGGNCAADAIGELVGAHKGSSKSFTKNFIVYSYGDGYELIIGITCSSVTSSVSSFLTTRVKRFFI
jgi:hypothetical protein